MDQRVRVALEGLDYMTTWESWLDVQNGTDLRGRELYEVGDRFRFISTPTYLATYVHYDALYQAYLNACIIMLNKKLPFDKGLTFQKDDDIDKQQGLALIRPAAHSHPVCGGRHQGPQGYPLPKVQHPPPPASGGCRRPRGALPPELRRPALRRCQAAVRRPKQGRCGHAGATNEFCFRQDTCS